MPQRMLADGGLNPSHQHSSSAVLWDHPPHPALPVLALQPPAGQRLSQPHLRPFKITATLWPIIEILPPFSCCLIFLQSSWETVAGIWGGKATLMWVSPAPTQSHPFQAGGRAGDWGDVGVSQPDQRTCGRFPAVPMPQGIPWGWSRGGRTGSSSCCLTAEYRETTAMLFFPPCSALVEEMLQMWVKSTQKPD